VVAGSGRKLFTGDHDLLRLSLLEADHSPQGTLFLTYATDRPAPAATTTAAATATETI
jgi:hypothetical protein